MPQITWNNIGDLDFSDSNSLLTKGNELMANGGETIVDVFKEVATKNAVFKKEERDKSFAFAVQGMSTAQDETQLRSSYEQAMKVEGLGADGVLGLTDTYKQYQKGLIGLQGARLDITGKNLENQGTTLSNQGKTIRNQKGILGLGYTKQTQPTAIQAKNAGNQGIIATASGEVSAINAGNQVKQATAQATIDNNLPQLDAKAQAVNAKTSIGKGQITNTILANTGGAQVQTGVNNIGTALQVSGVSNDTAGNIARIKAGASASQAQEQIRVADSNSQSLIDSGVQAQEAKNADSTRKSTSRTEEYYNARVSNELAKEEAARKFETAKVEAQHAKTVNERTKTQLALTKAKKDSAIAKLIAKNTTTFNKPGRSLQNISSTLSKSGTPMTQSELTETYSNLVKLHKAKPGVSINLGESSEKYFSKDNVLKTKYEAIDDDSKKFIESTRLTLANNGKVFMGDAEVAIEKSRQAEFMRGLLSALHDNNNSGLFSFSKQTDIDNATAYYKKWRGVNLAGNSSIRKNVFKNK